MAFFIDKKAKDRGGIINSTKENREHFSDMLPV